MRQSRGDIAETELSAARSPGADRMEVANEVGAAIAHQLNGPLTALLLYLEDLCQDGDRMFAATSDGVSWKQVAESALREAECVCGLVQRLSDAFEAPLTEQTAFAQGREIIRWWARAGQADAETRPAPATAICRPSLTTREEEVLALVREGYSNKEGAARLGISPRTFEGHRAALMRKFTAKNLADLLRKAAQDQDATDSHFLAPAGRHQAAPSARYGKIRCRS